MNEHKLTLAHLAAYLPYGLKVFRDCTKSLLYNDAVVNVDCIGYVDKIVTFNTGPDYYFDDPEIDFIIKPLLLPLMPIQNFVVLTTEECSLVARGLAHNIPQWKFEILVENHLDVFGLIDKGLALNKLDYEK